MGNVRLYGATSGYTELAPPAVAPDGVLSLPSGTGTIATQDYAAGAGGLVHIANVALSASNSVSVDNCFTSDYQFYRLVCDYTVNTNGDTRIRLRAGGTDSTTGYTYQYFYVSGTGTGATRATGTFFPVASANATIRNAFVIDLISPQLATATNFISNAQYGSSSAAIEMYNSTHSPSTAYDGFTFFSGAGVTTTGTIRVYGYSNGA